MKYLLARLLEVAAIAGAGVLIFACLGLFIGLISLL